MNFSKLLNWRLIAFYVGVPFIVAIYGAMNNYGIQQIAGYAGAISFYLSHSFIPWWITSLSTSFLMWAFNRLKPPPMAIMIPGSIIGCFLVLPYTRWITDVFEATWPTVPQTFQGIETHPWSGNFVEQLIMATVVWVGVNFIFDRFVGLPRYRYEIPRGYESTGETEDTSPEAAQPAFLSRLPAKVMVDELESIKAEQHYIHIQAGEREYMILYRFSDALSQLDSELGMQVHRSWWIAHEAIDGMQQSGKKFFVLLKSGERVPVSIPYQGMLKELARAKGIPVKPKPAT